MAFLLAFEINFALLHLRLYTVQLTFAVVSESFSISVWGEIALSAYHRHVGESSEQGGNSDL